MKDACIFDAIRTPRGIGNTNGQLYQLKPVDLLTVLLKAIWENNELDVTEVDDVMIGCVTPINDQGSNIARSAILYAGWAAQVGGMQINRFDASGLEAVNLAAMKIRSGWEKLIVAGGVESRSRIQNDSDGGALLYDPDVMNNVGYLPKGILADLVATIEKYDRKMLDDFALHSYERANKAWEKGYFKKAIIPIKDKNGLTLLEKDETLTTSISIEELSTFKAEYQELGEIGFDAIALKLHPYLEKINHLHTLGNASGNADGAALLLIGELEKGMSLGLKPRAKIIATSTVGIDHRSLSTGNSVAIKKALFKSGLKADNIDLWEINEAFAAHVLKTSK